MKENKKIACSRRRAVALLAAALLTAAAFWASVSRIAAAMTAAAGQYRDDNLPPWREGFLDVHHLQVGSVTEHIYRDARWVDDADRCW